MKNRIVAGALAVSALALALTGCAHQMSDEDIDSVREIACSLQNSYAQSADFAVSGLNPGEFWAIGEKVQEFSDTLQVSGRMGEVADAYAGFAAMFPEKVSASQGVFQEDVDTFNGHIEAIDAACEGNPKYEEPMLLEYPTDPEDRGYLQRADSLEEVE